MKFIEHIIDEEDCLESYSFLGLTLFERATVQYKRTTTWSNKPLKKTYKRYLGKVIYKESYFNRNGLCNKVVNLFSIPILSTVRLNGYKTHYILGVMVYSKPLKFLSDFKRECIDGIDKKHDDVYIILRHFGDAFRMLTMIKQIIKSRGSKNPLIMVFDDSFEELVKMLNLNIPYVKIQTRKPFKVRLNTQFSTDAFKLGGFRFFLLFNDWWYYGKVTPITRKAPKELNSLDLLAMAFNVSYDSQTMGKISILSDAEESMLKKSREAGLNLDNFVFLAPESFAVSGYSEKIWVGILKYLQETGCDIFVNTVARKGGIASYTRKIPKKVKIDNTQGVKSFYLTIAEAYALACRAKKIITQRSGFSEILTQAHVPMCVIYYNNNFMRGSLKKCPYADPDKIHEIYVSESCLDDSIKAVSEALEIKK